MFVNTEETELDDTANNKDESHKPFSEEGIYNNKPIITQPLNAVPQELPDSDGEENNKIKNDCCCEPYLIDGYDVYILCRCIAWFCVQIGKCTENCCEGCAECINACCNSQETANDNDNTDCDCSCFD